MYGRWLKGETAASSGAGYGADSDFGVSVECLPRWLSGNCLGALRGKVLLWFVFLRVGRYIDSFTLFPRPLVARHGLFITPEILSQSFSYPANFVANGTLRTWPQDIEEIGIL